MQRWKNFGSGSSGTPSGQRRLSELKTRRALPADSMVARNDVFSMLLHCHSADRSIHSHGTCVVKTSSRCGQDVNRATFFAGAWVTYR